MRADAEHDAKVMRDVTGRDWSVVRLVVADTNDRVPEAWTNLLAYVLQDELHNRLTPRVIDIAYTAFMQAKRPNDENGSASDWFNDTRPVVRELIAKLRKDLIKELAEAPQPVPSANSVMLDDGTIQMTNLTKSLQDGNWNVEYWPGYGFTANNRTTTNGSLSFLLRCVHTPENQAAVMQFAREVAKIDQDAARQVARIDAANAARKQGGAT